MPLLNSFTVSYAVSKCDTSSWKIATDSSKLLLNLGWTSTNSSWTSIWHGRDENKSYFCKNHEQIFELDINQNYEQNISNFWTKIDYLKQNTVFSFYCATCSIFDRKSGGKKQTTSTKNRNKISHWPLKECVS